MAQYKETVNTEKALNLIAKMLAGKIEQIDFTKIKVSDKDYSLLSVEELQKLEELEEIRQETLVSEKVLLDDNTINVHGIIYNTELENSYYLRTIGLYANDPDEGEILYSVTPASHADYVPTPNGNNITTLIIDLKTIIDGATVNLQGNPSALVDVSMLNKKLDKGEGLEEEFDTAVKIVNELKKKQNKEDSTLKTIVKTIVGAINELYDELIKKATKTQIGRIKVGNNLTVDEDGTLHGTPEYTHPTGAGNNHIPAGGSIGQVLKNSGNGVATWGDMDLGNYYTKTETDEKFKNFCPFPVNSLYLSLGSENPSSLWLGTTWAKQEGRFLLGSSSSYGLGSTGGASTVKLTVTNLPSHTHSATTAAHTHTQPTHTHTFQIRMDADERAEGPYYGTPGNGHYGAIKTSNPTTASGGDTTGSASPVTSIGSTGSGTAFSILPPYLVVNIWKRLS